jgi:hypothetical protein
MIIDIVCTFSATTIQAETKSVSLVLTFPATQLPSNICEEVKDCLGISESGDETLLLNQQGDWVAGGGGSQTLNEVLIEGNETDGEDILISDGDQIQFDNYSRIRKGLTDAGNGGAKGVALVCSLDYELKWEAGRLYTMQQDGFTIREVSHNFTATPTVNDDITKGFVIGSRWILDNGDVYVCSDETASAAVWALQVASVPTLQEVTDEGSITTNIITVGDTAGIYSEVADSYVGTANEANDTYAYLSNDGSLGLGNGTHESNLKNTNATTTGIILEFPNKAAGSYTIATTDEITNGTVTSVGLTMPSAFTVSNSPITSNGDIAVTGAGLVSQYVRGDGTLANFPASTGGGASLSFYLNGSVSQGTFGGVTYYEMNRTPILGLGTNFTLTNTNNYIASFLTDVGDPNQLNIPAGNWNCELYFNVSNNSGNPSFYIELYKYDGVTFTLIASSSTNPEFITNGTQVDLYTTAISVPQTTLLATDRLAVRVHVNTSGNRTVTLHTEDNNLCQVITTFSTGLNALNGLTAQVQNFAVGTSGTDFAISSISPTHTFNLPIASATNTGKLSSADWSTFNGKQNALGFTPENVANKSDSFTLSSSTTYASTKALVDGFIANGVVLAKTPTTVVFTGVVTERCFLVIPLPIGTDNYHIYIKAFVKAATTLSSTRLRIGTVANPIDGNVGANAIGNQTQIAILTHGNNNRVFFIRNFTILGGASGSRVGFNAATSGQSDEATNSTATTATLNTTVQNYIYLSYDLTNASADWTIYSAFATALKLN